MTLTRVVMPVQRSWTKTSTLLLVSPATRLLASEEKATTRPSALMAGLDRMPMKPLGPLPSCPRLLTLTRSVLPVRRSRTKMSAVSFVSPGTRSVARDENATNRPSGVMAAWMLS